MSQNHALSDILCTVDIGYMVIGYMVKSGIWSIMRWSRFSHPKKYRIYGQILDIWSENVVKFIAKTFDGVATKGLINILFALNSH